MLGETATRDALTAFDLLRRPEVNYGQVIELIGPMPELADERLSTQIRDQLEVAAKYAGYIERQEEEIARQRRNEETQLPADLDYTRVAGLSNEVRQKLAQLRPETVGQALARAWRDPCCRVDPAGASQEVARRLMASLTRAPPAGECFPGSWRSRPVAATRNRPRAEEPSCCAATAPIRIPSTRIARAPPKP